MKGRIPKERIIYSNYDLSETYSDEDIIETLMDNGHERENITDNMIWEERYFLTNLDWEEEYDRLNDFFEGKKWILFGEVGRWNGVYKMAKLFESFYDNTFSDATEDCDYWKIYDENGHLYLTCSHHDGTCHYEIREVTDKGIQYFDNWKWYDSSDTRSESYVLAQIINRYSRLPRFSEKVYGCKRFEWQPITRSALIDRLNNQAKSC